MEVARHHNLEEAGLQLLTHRRRDEVAGEECEHGKKEKNNDDVTRVDVRHARRHDLRKRDDRWANRTGDIDADGAEEHEQTVGPRAYVRRSWVVVPVPAVTRGRRLGWCHGAGDGYVHV